MTPQTPQCGGARGPRGPEISGKNFFYTTVCMHPEVLVLWWLVAVVGRVVGTRKRRAQLVSLRGAPKFEVTPLDVLLFEVGRHPRRVGQYTRRAHTFRVSSPCSTKVCCDYGAKSLRGQSTSHCSSAYENCCVKMCVRVHIGCTKSH